MKKILVWIAITALMIAGAGAESQDSLFSHLEGVEWCFSSGAGGWSTDMRILPDGSFSGEYHDSEMGESAEAYPNGTVYCCAFTGRMSLVAQLDDHSWRLRVDALDADGGGAQESVDDGIRFVFAEPYGISEGDEMTLYRLGTPVEGFTEDMLMWTHLLWSEEAVSELEYWFLYSEKNESGFVGFPPEPDASAPTPDGL